MGRGEEEIWAKDDDFCFIQVEFEEVVVHPGFYVIEAVSEGGESDGSDGFGTDIQMYFVSIAKEM